MFKIREWKKSKLMEYEMKKIKEKMKYKRNIIDLLS